MSATQLALALSQFAPQILRFFGAGEASATVAQKISDVASAVTGVTDPAQILEKLRGDAALQVQLQQKLLEIDAQLEEAHLADRKDARARDLEVRKLNAGKNDRADVMIIGAVVGLISCLVVLVFFRKDIPGEAAGIIATIAGIFGACLRDAYQFEFGDSRTGRMQGQTIASIAAGKLE